MQQKFTIVDLETTGQSSNSGDRIIQLAIVTIEQGSLTETFSTYIDPMQPIPPIIQELTAIKDEDVAQAKPFEYYAQRIYDMLQDSVFVAHNVDFDLNFLNAEFQRVGLPKLLSKKIDTVELVKILYPTALSYQLADITADLKIEIGTAHRADDDAIATAKLLLACWQKVLELPLITLETLHKNSFYLKSDVSHFLFEALQRKRQTVNHSEGVMQYRNLALKVMHEQVPHNEPFEYPKTREEKLKVLQCAMPNFEERAEQFQMMDMVYEAIQHRTEIAIEASTGIGKTLAYLLPALIHALTQNEKVIVSTHTTNLMEQVLIDELPLVEEILGQKIPVAHLKGMSHFIDLDLFANYCKLTNLSYDELLVRLQIFVWLTETETGDLDELTVSGGGMNFLEKIQTSPNNKKANFHFYARALQKAQDATLIVTNHAMLVADKDRTTKVFPNAGSIIIDEAHQMLKVMNDYDSKLFSFNRFKYLIGQIGTYNDGLLFTRLQKATEKTAQLSLRPLYLLENGLKEVMFLFDACIAQIVASLKDKLNINQPKQSTFISELHIELQLFRQFSNRLQNVMDIAVEVVSKLSNARLNEMTNKDKILVAEWQFLIEELKAFHVMWDSVFLVESIYFASWVEFDSRSLPSSLQFYQKSVQLNVSSKELFAQYTNNALIWTSGTLTVPQQERFILQQLGIDEQIPLHKYVAPASYYKGARAYIVEDMPDIQVVSQQQYIEAVANAIIQTARAMEGRSFVLFTSQKMLKETVERIAHSRKLEDYMLFAQGVTGGSKMKMLKAFQKFPKSILFGTNSFWEGVDVPGDGLSSVIVVRLPFTSPDEPTFKAKSYIMQKEGMNAFSKLSLPEAIIRFKQGFGRLIRSSSDRGAFIILDRRIEKKAYGSEFIESLPDISVQKLTLDDMVLQLKHWYNNER